MSNNSVEGSFSSDHSCSNCSPSDKVGIQIKTDNKDLILSGLPVQDEFAPNSICFGCGPSRCYDVTLGALGCSFGSGFACHSYTSARY